jgi:hypothetical protein
MQDDNEKGLLKFQRLLLGTLTLLRAFADCDSCPFFVAEQRKGERKSAKAFPLGFPLRLPRYIAHQEIDISIFRAVLQGRQHARQAKFSNVF